MEEGWGGSKQEQARMRSITGRQEYQGQQEGEGQHSTIYLFCKSRTEEHVDNIEDVEDAKEVEDVNDDGDGNDSNDNKQRRQGRRGGGRRNTTASLSSSWSSSMIERWRMGTRQRQQENRPQQGQQ